MKFRWLEEILHSSLHGTTKFVGIEIWTHSNKAGENAHPGTKTIARNLGISLRTVNTHVGILRRAGWIVRTSESNKSPYRDWADVYALVLPDRTQPGLRTVEARGRTDRTQRGSDRTQLGSDRAQSGLRTNKYLPTGFYQNSDPEGSGPLPRTPAIPANWQDEFEPVEEWLESIVAGMDALELNTALSMWEQGCNPRAIVNKLLADRQTFLESESSLMSRHEIFTQNPQRRCKGK